MGWFERGCAAALVAGVSSVAAPLLGQVSRIGGEFQVDNSTSSSQAGASVAVDGNGGFVVAWHRNADVFARRFDASGAPLGPEFFVNTFTPSTQALPSVSAGIAGDFVVAWQSSGQDGSGDGVFARRFSSAGAPLAAEFQVNSVTLSTQNTPAVSLGINGDFLIAWRNTDSSSAGVAARRFASTGSPIAAEFQVNLYEPGEQRYPAAAIGPDGAFVIAWQSDFQDGESYGIFARRFDSSAGAIGGEFQINVATYGAERFASLAIDGDGRFVVVWEGADAYYQGIFGRRFDVDGSPLGGPFQVNIHFTANQGHPNVRADGDGDFVVCWQSQQQDDPTYSGAFSFGVFARRFDSTGAAQTPDLQVNTYTTNNQSMATIGMGPGGDFVVAWEGSGQGDPGGVFAQRFAVLPKVFDIEGNGAVEALTDGLLFLRYTFGFRGSTLVSGAVTPDCSRCTAVPIESYLAGLAAVTSSKKSGHEFQVNAYTPGDQNATAAAADANGTFVVAWHSALDGSGLGIFARRFDQNGSPITTEFPANQYVTGAQNYPRVAMDGDGDFVVAWQSDGQDGSDRGIFARAFNSAGSPRADEFQVNLATIYAQQSPGIAMNAAGDFVVVWATNPEYGTYTVLGRRFNAALTPLGGEFVVSGVSRYSYPAVAMSPSGDFVVTWWLYAILGRRFNASGVAIGGEFQANTYVGDLQGLGQRDGYPAIDGSGFVVSWNSQDQDGSGLGVFARRFDSAGAAIGGEMQVNSFTPGNQFDPVAKAAGGGAFVITWTSAGRDGSGNGVFTRRYDSAGAPQAKELQVNTFTAGNQAVSTLAMAGSGNFVTAWQSAAQDGSGYGVFAQRFNSNRTADIDGDGLVAALTDGLLFLRYVFGFRGPTLITGAVGPNCTRCSAAAIETYIAGRV